MDLLTDPTNRRKAGRPSGSDGRVPLTRKALYDLAAESHQIASELARHDQHRVNLAQCHVFNDWLLKVKQYRLLAPKLCAVTPARPITRRQILIIGLVAGLFLFLLVPDLVGPTAARIILYAYVFTLIFFGFIPERHYGTTIELLEGKTLRVVLELEELLMRGNLDFSEAVFFQVKANLDEAKRELRQQIDLAHRQWR